MHLTKTFQHIKANYGMHIYTHTFYAFEIPIIRLVLAQVLLDLEVLVANYMLGM